MAETKTKPTTVKVNDFLDKVAAAEQRADARTLVEMMEHITGEKATMWGPSIVGCGTYHYVYDSGHEGDTCLAGFSPRKGQLVVYFGAGLQERFAGQIKKLGKCKVTKGCLYIKKLADVDVGVLREMIEKNVARLQKEWTAAAKPTSALKKKK